MHTTDPARQAWIDSARDVRIEDECARRGIPLKKVTANEYACPCPACDGDDRYRFNTRKQTGFCRQCDFKGDVIAMVMKWDGTDFNASVETLAGEPPPKTDKPNSKGNGHDHGADRKAGAKKIPVANFVYRDKDGRERFTVVRFHFRLPDGNFVLGENGKPKKSFGQKRPAPDGEPRVQVWGLGAGEYCRKSS